MSYFTGPVDTSSVALSIDDLDRDWERISRGTFVARDDSRRVLTLPLDVADRSTQDVPARLDGDYDWDIEL